MPIEKLQKKTGSLGPGNLSIERSKDDAEKKHAFLVFRNGVGKTLFSGQIIDKSKYIDAKKDHPVLKAITIAKEGESVIPVPVQITFH